MLTFCTIVYTGGHQYTKFHADVNMQTKVITILSFKWWPFWKFLMTAITITRWYVLTFCMICLMEAITKAGDMSTHLVWFGIQLTINTHIFMQVITFLSFQWWPYWKFKMAVTAPARSHVFISYMILIITNYQYTKFHVNIHMHNKVIEILSFQWRPFWKFKMAVTTAARSRVFISYMILTIKN